MDRLRLNNDTLDRLVNQSNELEPSRRERRRRTELCVSRDTYSESVTVGKRTFHESWQSDPR